MKRKGKQVKKKQTSKRTVLWELLFGKLLQSVDFAAMVTDNTGKVMFVNESFLDYFCFAKKDIIKKEWISVIIPEGKRLEVRKILSDIKKKKKLVLFDTPVMAAEKIEKYLCWTCVPLKEKQAHLYMFLGEEGRSVPVKKIRVHSASAQALKESYNRIIDILFAASKISEPDTAIHAARVMTFAVSFAKKLKLNNARIEKLKVAALLHDLGKLVVDEKILFKRGKLTKEEYDKIKKHPRIGSELVRLIYFLNDIVPIMETHHENYDGTGYPDGIKGEKIPLESRILGVADIYEALTADRPYRKGFSVEEAIAIMEYEKGRKLDPNITDIFIEMVRKGEFEEEKA